jgi:hypothetical protein
VHSNNRAPDRDGLLRRSDGTSLIDALVALTLVSVIAAGVAHLLVWARRTIAGAGAQTMAAMLAAEKMERLRSLRWDVDATGIAASDETTSLASEPPQSTGSGLRPSPAGALAANTPGFFDYADAQGRWRGSGAGPPPGTAFVRRWSIEAHAADPADTLVLRVVVLPLVEAAGGGASGRGVRLATIRTRSGR